MVMVEVFALFGSREGGNIALPPSLEVQGTQEMVHHMSSSKLRRTTVGSLRGPRGPILIFMFVGPDALTFDRPRGRGNWPRIHIRDIRRSPTTRQASFWVSCIFMQYVRHDLWSKLFASGSSLATYFDISLFQRRAWIAPRRTGFVICWRCPWPL